MVSELDNWPTASPAGGIPLHTPPLPERKSGKPRDVVEVQDCYTYIPESPGVGVLLLRCGAKLGLASIRYNYVNLITSKSESEIIILMSHYQIVIKGVRLWPLFEELHHGRATEVRVVEHDQQIEKLKKDKATIVKTIEIESLYDSSDDNES